MPWCPTCDRFLSPPTVTPEGRCPSCGRPVEPGRSHRSPRPTTGAEDNPAAEEEQPPVPLHLKILGVSVVVYLGWRFIQGVEWVIHRF